MIRRIAAALLILYLLTPIARAQQIEPANPIAVAPQTTPAVTNQFVTAYPTLGGPLSQSQPTFANLAGALNSAQCPVGTTGARGCLEVGGGLSVLAGIVQIAPFGVVPHQFITSFSSSGVPQTAQPTATDISTSINGLVSANGSSFGAYAGSGCTNQVVTSLNSMGTAICSSIVNALLSAGAYSNITGVGALTAGGTSTGFTVDFGSSTITGVLSGTNGGTGVNNGAKTITLGASLISTGAGNTTLAFPGSPGTFIFPTTAGGDTLAGLKGGNVFAAEQIIDLNTASVPSIGSPVSVMAALDGSATISQMFSAAHANSITMFRANNTLGSPSVINNGNTLGYLQTSGWNGSAYNSSTGARLVGLATETWNTGATGTQWIFTSIPTGSATPQDEMVLQGGVALGVPGGVGFPQGLGTMNAPNGYWVQNGGTPLQIATALGKGIFPGGLTATLATSGAALNNVCYNSSTGVFTYSGSGCTSSSLRYKHDVRPISGALGKLMAFDPIEFHYNDETNIKGPQIGLSAESVAASEPVLATFDNDGRPEAIKYMEVIGLLVAAVQEQQREINDLRRQ